MERTAPRRTAVRERPGARAAAALLLSALANGLAVLALGGAGALRPPAPRTVAIALAPVTAAEWEARRRVAADPAAPSDRAAGEAQPEVNPVEPPAGIIVSVAPSQDPRRPERARFLAERDNTVERETQWRGPVDRSLPVAARPTAGAEGVQGIPVPGEEGAADTSEAGREGAAASGLDATEARITRARRALAEGGEAPADDAAAKTPPEGDGGARRAGRFDPRVLPLGAAFAAAGAGSPAGDPLPGVEEGDATLVNTRAFRFAAFYRRVYEAIRGEWRPNEEWDARDPHDRVLGRAPRRVVVTLVLDRDGGLRDAKLARGSGLEFFDRECLRAVAAAAPFPNPPRALVGRDGLVVVPVPLLFEWGSEALLDRLLPGR